MTTPARPRSFIGLDLGTSGCRAIAIDSEGQEIASRRVALPDPEQPHPGWSEQDPALWWRAVTQVLAALALDLRDQPPAALCVDATSATLLLANADGEPLGPALMYNDRRAVEAAPPIAAAAPEDSPARGAGSSLAKLIHLHKGLAPRGAVLALHQADWILGRLSGNPGFSDWNNALKLGYDAESMAWPGWVRRLLPAGVELPRVLAPGTVLGPLTAPIARELGFPATALVMAGTTDSTAAAIAAGVRRPGDAITSLGSTLVVKVLSERPVSASRYGVYSQRFGAHWLVGGASNSGGAVLRHFFSEAELTDLSLAIDPEVPSGLDYYPLLAPGERFPRQDAALEPRLHPRPTEPARFLQGLLEGIAAIEAEAHARLAELGAPRPNRVISLGGGAANPTWTRIRARRLGLQVIQARHREAAYGAAMLARGGAAWSELVLDAPHP